MLPTIVPPDSIFHDWLTVMGLTEVPVSYALAAGLSGFGCSLRRRVYVDQERWKVYPNLSILLVGPSGIGKDIAIDHGETLIKKLGQVPSTPARTIEGIYARMIAECGYPACAFIPAPEVSAFMGKKDYQESMAQELTALLSTKDYHDVSTKGEGKTVIVEPTVTMMTGSTEEWLHRAMPDGSLEGGLWPRFLIMVEWYGKKFVPLVGFDNEREVLQEAYRAEERFYTKASELIARFNSGPARGHSFVPLLDARYLYTNWYINRFRRFSPSVVAYANRCRDQVLRIALIMAASRDHDFIEETDIQFGIDMLAHVADNVERALKPPTEESRCARELLRQCPGARSTITGHLADMGFTIRTINSAEAMLRQSHRLRVGQDYWEEIPVSG
jgi:hypothetical protein